MPGYVANSFSEVTPFPRAGTGKFLVIKNAGIMLSRMRRIGFLVLALAFGFNVLILLVLILHKEPVVPEGRLANGTVLRIEKLTYGTNHVFTKGSSVTGKLRKILPGPLEKLLGSANTASTITEKPELLVWYQQVDPTTKAPIASTVQQLQVVDTHGCIFPIYNTGTTGSDPNLHYVQVPVFPRRQEAFLLEAPATLGGAPLQISVPNPFRIEPHAWKPEPFPIHRKAGELEFVCTDVQGKFFPNGAYFEPHFEVFDKGQDRTDRYRPEVTYVDETGNRGQRLCRYEAAWKLEVNFYKRYTAPFAESEIARINEVSVPDSGQVIQKDAACSMGNMKIALVALCGPGDYKFSNQVCVAAAPWEGGWNESSGSSSSYNGNQRLVEIEFRKKKVSLILDVKNLDRYQELLIRARDKQGRFYPANFNLSSESLYRYEMDFPPGLGKVDLEFIPQKPIQVDFMVKPPQPK
jgi:hypothetical protein